MNVERVIDAIAARVPKPEREYVDGNGITRCAVCHAQTITEIEFDGKKKTVRCACKCETEEERQERLAKMARRRRRCFKESKMQNWTFALDDRKRAKISDALARYAANFETHRKTGQGVLLYGTVGTGKTYLAACIANAVIDSGFSCKMVSAAAVAKEVQGKIEGRQEYINSLTGCDLLVIDDLGSERKTESGFAQEILYDIINERYNAQNPFIVTSNLTADQLKNPESTDYARIFDRVLGRCFPIEMSGASRRRAALKETYNDMKDMLGL